MSTEVHVPAIVKYLTLSVLVTSFACDGGDDTCLAVEDCGATPVGTWELVDCDVYDDLTYTEGTLQDGTMVVRTCVVELTSHDLVASSLLVIASGGSFTRASRFEGAWSGVAGASCTAEWGLACADLVNVLDSFGATSCTETAVGCSCEGLAAKRVDDDGSWTSGGGRISLDGAGGSSTGTSCASTDGMRIDWGGEVEHFRRLAP